MATASYLSSNFKKIDYIVWWSSIGHTHVSGLTIRSNKIENNFQNYDLTNNEIKINKTKKWK